MTKLSISVIILVLVVLAAGCATTTTKSPSTPAVGTQSTGSQIIRTSLNKTSPYHAELAADPVEIKEGETATLIFTVKDGSNTKVSDLPLAHEKPMHLLVVSDDLAEFNHLHPELQPDGTYKVTYAFPHGGGYKLYADFTPRGENQVVERFDLSVKGSERARVPLVADSSPSKTVDGLSVTMSSDKPLRAGQDLMLNFSVADASSGQPVKDLQLYLGALAHFVIISEDATEFIHAHPMSGPVAKPAAGASSVKVSGSAGADEAKTVRPTVSAHTSFPRAGLYKVWAQLQREGRVITVPFVVRVAEAEPGSLASKGGATAMPPDAIKITVSSSGFEPEEIRLRKGQTAKLAFYRADADNCASEVIFPSLGIRKELPVGQTTLVEVTPTGSGDLAFSCGVDMLKGKLVITE